MAVPPASCPDPAACWPALEAVARPALLQGAIDLYQLFLERLDKSPRSTADLQARIVGKTYPAWKQDWATSYFLRVLAIKRKELKDAVAALQPLVASKATAEAAGAAVAELQAESARLDAAEKEPGSPPPSLPVWKPAEWLRLGARIGKL